MLPGLDVKSQWTTVVDETIDTSSRYMELQTKGLYTEGGIPYRAGFNRKQNRYVAAIKNNSVLNTSNVLPGQVLIGSTDSTGYKRLLLR